VLSGYLSGRWRGGRGVQQLGEVVANTDEVGDAVVQHGQAAPPDTQHGVRGPAFRQVTVQAVAEVLDVLQGEPGIEQVPDVGDTVDGGLVVSSTVATTRPSSDSAVSVIPASSRCTRRICSAIRS